MLPRQSIIRGAAFIIGAQVFSVILGGLIKQASEDLPLEMIVFFRNIFGLLFLLPFIAKSGLFELKTKVVGWHLLRAVFGLGSMYSYFYVVTALNLANATAIIMLAPIMIPFAAFFILNEQFSIKVFVASIVGFTGVVVVLQPEGNTGLAGFTGVVGACFVALSQVSIKKLSLTEPAYRIVLYFTCFALVASSIPLVWAWQIPSTYNQWLSLLMLGGAATISQLCLAKGYLLAPVSTVGVLIYTSILFSAFVGWAYWDETWDVVSIAGSLLIIMAGVIVFTSNESQKLKAM